MNGYCTHSDADNRGLCMVFVNFRITTVLMEISSRIFVSEWEDYQCPGGNITCEWTMALPVGQKISQSHWPLTSFRGLKIMLSILFSEGEKQNMLHCSSVRYTSCLFELVIITRSPHCHHSLPYIPVRATDIFISESISVASLWYLPLCPTHEMRGPPFKIPCLFSSNCVYIQSS